MVEVVEEIKCSNCGAPLQFEPGEIIVSCKYCGYTSTITTREAFTLEHSLLLNQYTNSQITDLMYKWMRVSFAKPSDLENKAKLTEANLKYLPFWSVPVEASSTYKGVFERTGLNIVKEGVIKKNYNWLVLGRRAATFPTREYEIPLEGKIPFDFTRIEKSAQVLNSEITELEAIEIARQEIEAHHKFLASQDVDKIIEIKTEFKVEDAVYIHAPIWFLAYNYKGEVYRIIIDGASGEVIKGEMPTIKFSLF
ncbi:MAG: hypothetical protein HY929_05635 [Euryarchaeota archaeon]|nr:hypothetical protein [Euryarchaeota archaeon]